MAPRRGVRYASRARARFAEEGELPLCGEIGSRAFNTYAMNWYAPGKTICLEGPGGRLVACLVLTPLPGWWGSAQVPMCSIGAVATEPSQQRQGYAGALMVGAVRILREQGYAVAPLWPFSFRYYGKFGWALGSLDLQIKARTSQLRALGHPRRVRPARPSELPAVRRLYRRFARGYNGCSVRPQDWWLESKRKFPERYLVHRGVDGEPAGYLRYELRPRPYEEGTMVSVREFVARDGAVEGDLCAALAGLPEVSLADFVVPADACLPLLAGERLEMSFVQRLDIRVLDPLRALCSLRPHPSLKGTLGFCVEDWVVNAKRPLYLAVDIEDGRVVKGKKRSRGGIRCSIQTFAQLFSGFLPATRARGLGRVEAGRWSDLALCDRLLYGRIPFRSPEEAG